MSESKVANPGPLGLCGFALTTFVLSVVNAGFLKGTNDVLVVLGLALFYGGLVQLLAGMWEFRAGNIFGATAFSSYGAFWLSWAALSLPAFGGALLAKPAPTNGAVGIYLLGWAVFTGIMLVASVRTNGATVLVFLLLFLTFLLLAIGALGSNAGIDHIGGYIGILTAIAAWYAALAQLLAGVSGGGISLPIMPLNLPVRATTPKATPVTEAAQ